MRKVHTKSVYLDYASTTPVHPEIARDVQLLTNEYFANADSLHAMGQRVAELVEQSRKSIATMLGVLPHEVIFTSGASESNSTAIKGIALANQHLGKHIITSNIEHSSVEASLHQLETYFGYEVDRIPVNEEGIIDPSVLMKYLRSDTCLVTIMAVNNEIGSIFPVSEYARLIKKHSSAYFHVDGVQAFTKHDFEMTQIDAVSYSAHKINGIKGSGLLVKKANVQMLPLINGGQQEKGMRGGTLNSVAAIVFAKTIRLAFERHKQYHDKVKALHDSLVTAFKNMDGVTLNSPEKGSIYIVNVSIDHVGSEIMMNALNAQGYYVSARSTCHSQSNQPAPVIKALGRSDQQALSSIRISLSDAVTQEDIETVIKIIMETKSYVQHKL